MKMTITKKALFTLLILLQLACTSHADHPQATHLLGEVKEADVLGQYPSFSQEYESFEPSPEALAKVQGLSGKSVTVLFATWCHDSEREVPRFLKLLKRSRVTLAELNLVALDFNKQDPEGVAMSHQLKYTPTIIVFEQGKELGRIIERPAVSLSEDLAQMLQ